MKRSERARAAYNDYKSAYLRCLCGPRVDREEWIDDLRAAAIYRESMLAWYQRYRKALAKEQNKR